MLFAFFYFSFPTLSIFCVVLRFFWQWYMLVPVVFGCFFSVWWALLPFASCFFFLRCDFSYICSCFPFAYSRSSSVLCGPDQNSLYYFGVSLAGTDGFDQSDFMLPVCYFTTNWPTVLGWVPFSGGGSWTILRIKDVQLSLLLSVLFHFPKWCYGWICRVSFLFFGRYSDSSNWSMLGSIRFDAEP